jgi:hypothetical protein
MRILRVTLFALALSLHWAYAQGVDAATTFSLPRHEFSEAIEDNSFLIEEAYNQEPGVVQHISTGVYFPRPHQDFQFGFTQEWPLAGQTHQVSYTIPYSFTNENNAPGVGDILLSYRYQLCTSSDWAAVAPRFSLIIASGSVDKGLGSGSMGIQFAVPVSKRLSDFFVVHLNASATVLPEARRTTLGGNEVRRTLNSFSVGGSVIVLVMKNVNVMVEALANSIGEISEAGNVVHSHETVVNPGLRFAIDFEGLQVVPGVGIPMSFLNGDSRLGAFFYLSFEHPF